MNTEVYSSNLAEVADAYGAAGIKELSWDPRGTVTAVLQDGSMHTLESLPFSQSFISRRLITDFVYRAALGVLQPGEGQDLLLSQHLSKVPGFNLDTTTELVESPNPTAPEKPRLK